MADMNVLFALPGLHRVHRGAEVAIETVASELSRIPGFDVTLIGSGQPSPDASYDFITSGCIPRERFERYPKVPPMRTEYIYEELTFAPGLARKIARRKFDVTLTCSFPFTNIVLRSLGRHMGAKHVYITQNGDWPAYARKREYRLFGCDGLVVTCPEYLEHNRDRWNCRLIPNGVDVRQFRGGQGDRAGFGLPLDGPLVLMVSALVPTKRVVEGMRACAAIPGVAFVVAGDGPLRDEADRTGRELFGDRYRRVSVSHSEMPDLYRCADVFLHMSTDESFGNVYLEALATGLPIVAHDRDLTHWVIGDKGWLVDTSRADATSAAIGEALHARQITDWSVPCVDEQFTWPHIALRYGEFLTSVVEGS
jgi:glycosyltransferase involved in cell wall biosynthesis